MYPSIARLSFELGIGPRGQGLVNSRIKCVTHRAKISRLLLSHSEEFSPVKRLAIDLNASVPNLR